MPLRPLLSLLPSAFSNPTSKNQPKAAVSMLSMKARAYLGFPPATLLVHRHAHRSCFRSVPTKKLKAQPSCSVQAQTPLIDSGRCRHKQNRDATSEIIQRSFRTCHASGTSANSVKIKQDLEEMNSILTFTFTLEQVAQRWVYINLCL